MCYEGIKMYHRAAVYPVFIRNLNAACRADDAARELLLLSCERLNLSNRAYTRILKVARTIADLEGAEIISAEHVSEAVQYRTLDRKYWG